MQWQIPGLQYRCSSLVLCWILLLFSLFTTRTCQAVENVTILLSEDGAAYNEFASQLANQLGPASANKINVKTVYLSNLKPDDISHGTGNQLLIAVGTPAMTAMAQKPPAMSVLNALVPQDTFQKISRQYGRHQDLHHFSAIYFNQPWNRQLTLIRTALPGRNRIGILISKDAGDMIASLQIAAKELDMQISVETVNDDSELLPALRHLLSVSDAVLALPDPAIYNRNNIPTILLSSYRQKVPLFGFSAAYVKAGALAAVYSSPAQIAQQVSEIILGLPSHGGLPLPQYPRHFNVSVNTQVSRSLSLDIEDESLLTRKLKLSTERVQ